MGFRPVACFCYSFSNLASLQRLAAVPVCPDSPCWAD
jgi:hypothetical protein